MLAQQLPLGCNDDPLRIDRQAQRPVGKGCRHAVAVAIEGHQARRRHPLGLLTKPSNGRPSPIKLASSMACTTTIVPGSFIAQVQFLNTATKAC